ncbi:MAG: hypothetical protein JST47_04380 [Bacteroidetes bacterium]|nr:hypothetical protein [Bacteroidota bacterium]MBS1974242.1 hypothetical protein [Bacteroidota bacterium]
MRKTLLSTLGFIVSLIFITAQTHAQRVNRIDVSVDHPSYSGACPAKITFKAVIHYSGAGTLRYQWARSDGAHPPIMTIQLDGSGTRVINTTWQLGAAGKSYSGWEAVKVLSPGSFESSRGEFNLTCTGTAPQRTVGSPARQNTGNPPIQHMQAPVTNVQAHNPPKNINDTLHLNRRPVRNTPVQMQRKPLKPQVQSAAKTPTSGNQ